MALMVYIFCMTNIKIDSSDNREMERLNKIATICGLAVFFIVPAYAIFLIYHSWPINLGNVDKAGVFGDSFGIFTALFSGLAFLGIVFTILLQREELSLTRDELKNQVEATKHQNFENTFFQMLKFHGDIVDGIDIRGQEEGVYRTGRDCFVKFFNDVRGFYKAKDQSENLTDKQKLEAAYQEFWNNHQSDLGHYFRYLYNMFKFVKESDVENKRLYTNIIRAQLSDQELGLLFYNCLNKHGINKFKPLAEEFALFNNLPLNMLFAPEHHTLYDKKAYG